MHKPRRITFILLLTITALMGCEKSYVNRPQVPPPCPAPCDSTCVDPDEDDDDKQP